MEDFKKIMLDDALQCAIETTRELYKVKRALCISVVMNITLFTTIVLLIAGLSG